MFQTALESVLFITSCHSFITHCAIRWWCFSFSLAFSVCFIIMPCYQPINVFFSRLSFSFFPLSFPVTVRFPHFRHFKICSNNFDWVLLVVLISLNILQFLLKLLHLFCQVIQKGLHFFSRNSIFLASIFCLLSKFHELSPSIPCSWSAII